MYVTLFGGGGLVYSYWSIVANSWQIGLLWIVVAFFVIDLHETFNIRRSELGYFAQMERETPVFNTSAELAEQDG